MLEGAKIELNDTDGSKAGNGYTRYDSACEFYCFFKVFVALLRLSIYWKVSFESHCQKFNFSKVVVFESECLSLTCWRVTCENDFSKKLLCILALTFTYFCFHLTSYVSRLVLFTVHAGSPGAVSQQYLTDCFYHVAAPLPFGLICFVVLVI